MMKKQTLTHWLISLFIIIFTFLIFQPVSAQSLVNPTIGTKLLTHARSFWPHPRNHNQFIRKGILHSPQAFNQDEPDAHETLQELTPTPSEGKVIIYIFWGDGCPHCEIARPAIKSFAKRLDNVEVKEYEVWYIAENQQLFVDMASQLGFTPQAVPTIIIGDKYWEGFAESLLPEMENAILTCQKTGCSVAETAITPISTPTIASLPTSIVSADEQVKSVEFTPTEVPPLFETGVKSPSSGFTLAIMTIVGMVVALIFSGIRIWQYIGRSYPPKISETQEKWRNAFFLVFILIGLGVAGYLAYVETQVVPAVCGPVGDCNAVQSSPYAYVFGWLPVGVLGVFGYLAILAAWGWTQLSHDRLSRYIHILIFGMTLFGVLFSLYLTILEPFVIKAVCMWCVSSAIIMTLLYLLSLDTAIQSVIGVIDAKEISTKEEK